MQHYIFTCQTRGINRRFVCPKFWGGKVSTRQGQEKTFIINTLIAWTASARLKKKNKNKRREQTKGTGARGEGVPQDIPDAFQPKVHLIHLQSLIEIPFIFQQRIAHRNPFYLLASFASQCRHFWEIILRAGSLSSRDIIGQITARSSHARAYLYILLSFHT